MPEDEIPSGRGPSGISDRPRGSGQRIGNAAVGPDGPDGHFCRPDPDVSKLPPDPTNKNSQLLAQPAAFPMRCGEDEIWQKGLNYIKLF